MDRQSNINFIKSNILTVSQVCELVEVSRQMINRYVHDEKLSYIEKTQNGYLFYRPDVLNFMYEMKKQLNINNPNNPNNTRNITYDKNGTTRASIKFFEETILDRKAIDRVNIYFNDIDPILDGYYDIEEQPSIHNDLLFRVDAPKMIIKDKYNNETWLSGCNCGYHGEGPSGARKLLLNLDVPDDIAAEVYCNRVVKFIKSDNTWELITSRDSAIERKWDIRINGDIYADIFSYNGNLVLIQNKDFGWDSINLINLLEKYKAFIPQPNEIVLYLNSAEARERGFYRKNLLYSYGVEVYQLIIKDISGRELWMNININENEDLSEHEDLNSIIRACGFDYQFPKNDRTFSNFIVSWFTNGGRQNEPKIIIRK